MTADCLKYVKQEGAIKQPPLYFACFLPEVAVAFGHCTSRN